jgi:hypothetical protein
MLVATDDAGQNTIHGIAGGTVAVCLNLGRYGTLIAINSTGAYRLPRTWQTKPLTTMNWCQRFTS